MLFINKVSDTIPAEFCEYDNVLKTSTSGAELEFLPLTDFTIYRLDAKIIEKLKPIYELSKLNGKMISRQPHFGRFIQMLVTVGLINHYASIQYPQEEKYYAKLNRVDFEKHKQAMLKTASKYDNINLAIASKKKSKKTFSLLAYYLQKVKNSFKFSFKYNFKYTYFQHSHESLNDTQLESEVDEHRIEKVILQICDHLESLNLVESPGDNVLKVGIDGSVHGTNTNNIHDYEKLFKTSRDKRFRFRIYSGQEIGFPVCDSIEETIDIYKFVVGVLKNNGVHFTTTSGVHLHVGIEKQAETTTEIINHLANITSASVAVSQVLNNILPPTRRNNRKDAERIVIC
ncbi:amidoligase family protein [Brunnivagina elsteri]|uniref:Amidoligase n=1 Tax=Brunnivagina elsteri CCALA 953 TaxID=987040 RepID=A0A2A2TLU2_9CYAN|nr:amidoligase family protein [Calothrix elsteri]PAX58468.1 hypothetical protein CK510_07320 [Calothrix elsteri CCALA 953]